MSAESRLHRRGDPPPDDDVALCLRVEDWLLGGPDARRELELLHAGRELDLGSALTDIASCEPLDFDVIQSLATFAAEWGVREIREDLGCSTLGDRRFPLPIPVPACDEAVAVIAARARWVQRLLPVPLRLQALDPGTEAAGDLPQSDFLAALRAASGREVRGPEASAAGPGVKISEPRPLLAQLQDLRERILSSPEHMRAHVEEAMRRIAIVLGPPPWLAAESDAELVLAMLRTTGPRGIDPVEWAERLVAHAWLTVPGSDAGLAELEDRISAFEARRARSSAIS